MEHKQKKDGNAAANKLPRAKQKEASTAVEAVKNGTSAQGHLA